MTKYMYLFFFISSSLSAVKDLPPMGDSRTIIFEEHPPAKIMMNDKKNILKEHDKSISCFDNIIRSSDDKKCDIIDCAAGVCLIDGAVKLLVCLGLAL